MSPYASESKEDRVYEKRITEERRQEGLDRIAEEVAERRAAGAPALPSPPVKGVPYVAPKAPPGKPEGAAAEPAEMDDLAASEG
jgi:hypothetical protein